tara:strand:- start:462 stop:1076 length:615 start_codon:yes stop_codon:yes gene_type:complete
MVKESDYMSVMALDIETKNMSHEIGGFGNTHMFQVSTVATWDGNTGTVYVDEPVDTFAKSGHIVKSLSDLKYDLDEHFEKGGVILGHNIVSFDLPILKNSMDIYCIRKYLDDKRYIDTSRLLTADYGERFRLQNLGENTLKQDKLMDSADAPKLWKMGRYDEVVEYCLKDTQIVYDLWKYGQDNGIVKAFSIEKEEFVELEVDW